MSDCDFCGGHGAYLVTDDPYPIWRNCCAGADHDGDDLDYAYDNYVEREL